MEFSKLLKSLREKKGISLTQLASLTGIEEKFLKALEEKKWEVLPPDIYVQGYLRKLSQTFNLDFSELWKLYQAEKRLSLKNEENDFFPELKQKPKSIKLDLGKTIWVALIILGLAYIIFNLKPLFLAPKLELVSPAFDFVSFKDRIEIKGKTNATSLFINGKRIKLKKGKFFYEFPLIVGLNIIKIEAKNQFGKTKIIERKIIYQPK